MGDVVLAADGRHRVVLENDPPEAREGLVPTGPLWAATGLRAEGEPGRIELAALSEDGLEPEDLRSPGGLRPRGARRPHPGAESARDVAWRRSRTAPGRWCTAAPFGNSFVPGCSSASQEKLQPLPSAVFWNLTV